MTTRLCVDTRRPLRVAWADPAGAVTDTDTPPACALPSLPPAAAASTMCFAEMAALAKSWPVCPARNRWIFRSSATLASSTAAALIPTVRPREPRTSPTSISSGMAMLRRRARAQAGASADQRPSSTALSTGGVRE